ncbi:hypothetical protein ACVXG7_29505 [Enterobacter hormaechei]
MTATSRWMSCRESGGACDVSRSRAMPSDIGGNVEEKSAVASQRGGVAFRPGAGPRP